MVQFFEDRFIVAVNYKSGITQKFKCKEFNFTRGANGGVSEVRWDEISVRTNRPFFINVDEIESVWVVKTYRAFKFRLVS